MRLFRNTNEIFEIDTIALFSSGIIIIDFIIITGSLNMIIKSTLGDNFLITKLSFADNFLIIFLKVFYRISNKNY